MKSNKKFIIAFMLLLTCLVSISTVSAVNTNDSSDNISSTSVSDISVSDVFDSVNTNGASDDDKINAGGDNSKSLGVSNINDNPINSVKKTISVNGNTFKDIQDAINSANETDTIELNGYYTSNGTTIIINKSLTLIGNNTTLDGENKQIMQVNSPTVSLKNIKFTNCNASVVGAIYWGGINGSVSGCSFTNCNASFYGGPICWDGANGSVSGCSFTNCKSDYFGGAIYWYGANGSVSGCSFTNCSASSGGAIYWNNGVDGSVSGCSFTNCSASSGGAINWNNGVDGSVSGCSFTNCSASSGGAINWNNGVDGSVSGCSFTNCNFSAIYWGGVNGSVSGCSFTNCNARFYGGAILWDGANGNVSDCIFINCGASFGGAIYWYGVDGSVSGCSFSNCNAMGDGGAIYWYGVDGSVSGCSFSNCNAHYGGAIYWYSANGTVSGCNFTNNVANNGSAIYVKSTLVIDKCNFDKNLASSFNLTLVKYGDFINSTLIGGDNVINSIYDNSGEETVVVNGIPYTKSDKELGENITITFNLINGTSVNKTCTSGKLISIPDGAIFASAEHPESDLYTYVNCSNVLKFVLTPTVVVTDASAKYGEGPEFKSNVTCGCIDVSNNGTVTYRIYDNATGGNEVDPSNLIVGHTYYVEAIFNSSDKTIIHDTISERKEFTVDYMNTTIIVESFEGKPGQNVSIPITVTDENGDSVSVDNVTVVFADGNNTTALIADGKANFTLPKNITSGNVTIQYLGEIGRYEGSNVTVGFTAIPLNVTINISDFSGKPGQKVSVPINVTDENGDSVSVDNVTVVFADGNNTTVPVVDGKANFTLPKNITTGNVTIQYPGVDGKYEGFNTTVNFTAIPLNVTVSVGNITGNPGSKINVDINVTDENGDTVDIGNVTLVTPEGNSTVPVVNGSAALDNITLPTDVGNYTFNITYSGDESHNPANYSFNVSVLPVNVTVSADNISGKPGSEINITVNVTDEDGNPVTGGNVTLVTPEGNSTVPVVNGSAVLDNITLPSKPGSYNFTIVYSGDETHAPISYSFKVDVFKTNTKITASKGKIYNGDYYKVTLKDANGNALDNKKVVITILGKKYTATTDKNGVAKVKVKAAKKYLGKSLKVSYKFAGDNNYNGISGSTMIKVVRMSVKITNATAKIVKNHKYFYVKLSTRTGKVLKNKIITMHSTVSGKNYKIKTNSKGIAKTDLWVEYHPTGHYYKYIFKFKGNNYYNSCSKAFKVKLVK